MPPAYVMAQGSTPTDYRALFLTVGGALLGVLSTVVVQAINSRIQRRHESESKLFEKRLAIYTKIVDLTYRLATIHKITRQYSEAMESFIRATDSIDAELAKLQGERESKVAELQAMSCDTKGGSARHDLEKNVESIDEALDAAMKRRMSEFHKTFDNLPGLDKVEEGSDTYREWSEFMRDNTSTIRVISSRSTDRVLQTFWSTLGQENGFTPKQLRRVRFVVRRELGIGRPYFERVTDWLADLRSSDK